MSDVLIATFPGDIHAIAVEAILTGGNISVDVWFGSEFPVASTATIEVSKASSENCNITMDVGRGRSLGASRSFWRRRDRGLTFSPDLHPSDRKVAFNEGAHFYDGLHYAFDETSGFCVNPLAGFLRAKNKIAQLCAAKNVGFCFPETIFSNDISDVRDFFAAHSGKVIAKSFTSPTWINSDKKKTFSSFVNRINSALLENVDTVAAVPTIYQRVVNKMHEVRALFMGRTYFAVLIDSQKSARTAMDWRTVNPGNLILRRTYLSGDVLEKCYAFMAELGIVTGSFDFAVDDNGELTFFEVNEQGQFLWLEEHCPDVPCLQVFSEFLISRDSGFEWDGKVNQKHSLNACLSSSEYIQVMRDQEARFGKFDWSKIVDEASPEVVT